MLKRVFSKNIIFKIKSRKSLMFKPEKRFGNQGQNQSTKRVSCNGGGGPLGHPQIWLTLGKDGTVVCPYCSKKFEA